MTPATQLWIASGAIAFFFFVAGYLAARFLSARPARAVSVEIASDAALLEAAGGADTEAGLERVLGSVAKLPGFEGAALADELGLPIASVGDHGEPLAAFAGFVDSVAEKSTMYLPMSRVRRISVADDMNRTLTARPKPFGDSKIAIVTLTTGPGPQDEYLDEVLASASRAIGQA